MCVNYTPPTRQQLIEFFHSPLQTELEWPREAWQDYGAPIIRHDSRCHRAADLANYGMVPKAHLPPGVRFTTMNCRDDGIATKKSFSSSWKHGRLCLCPIIGFFEPSWETGKAIRHRISMADGRPFAVASIWRDWTDADSGFVYPAFSQITINADNHPLMNRFHKPGDEKRTLVIIPEQDFDDWLACRNPEVARTFLRPYPADLMIASPAPIPPRPRKNTTGTLNLEA